MHRMTMVAAIGLLFIPSQSVAQRVVPVSPQELHQGQLKVAKSSLQSFSRLYRCGEWKKLQDSLQEILKATQIDSNGNPVAKPFELGLKQHHYFVVFPLVGAQGVPGTGLARILLHDPMPDPFENTLPGFSSKELRQIFLHDPSRTNEFFSTVYAFTETKDPISEQLPAFFKGFSKPMFEFQVAKDSVNASLPFTVSDVPVPFKRAKIKIQDDYRYSLGTKTVNLPKTVHEFENTPPNHWSLGTQLGSVISTWGDQKAKLDNGNLTQKSPGRLLTMVNVNFHPFAYQAKSRSFSWQERLRVFAGIASTPEPGIGAGVGYGVIRGFSLSVGIAGLFVDTIADEDDFGNPPSDPTDPFRTGMTSALFVAGAYNFK